MCRGLTGFDQYSAWPWSPRRPFAASACAKLIAARWAGRAAWGRRKHTNSTIHAGVQSDNRDNGSFPSCEPRHLNNSRWDVSFGPRLKSPAERRSVFLTKLIEVSPDVESRQQNARARRIPLPPKSWRSIQQVLLFKRSPVLSGPQGQR